MQVNTESLILCPMYLHHIYGSILEIILAIVLLWFYIGVSGLIGLSSFALLAPFNLICSKKYSDAEIEKFKIKDQKVKIINEVLNGIKVYKKIIWNLNMRYCNLKTDQLLNYLN